MIKARTIALAPGFPRAAAEADHPLLHRLAGEVSAGAFVSRAAAAK
jgi:hypothetical protein